MSEKTQFTPEDVGRTFETSEPNVTAKLEQWDDNPISDIPCLFSFKDGKLLWAYIDGNIAGMELQVFPSRPVEEQTELHPAIQHISAEGDISNETIELINKLAEIAYGSPVASKPTTNEESPSPHPCERSC